MKKFTLLCMIMFMLKFNYGQKFEIPTTTFNLEFKRHYSCSVEGAFENGQVRQVIGGNVSDWLLYNRQIDGMLITGNVFSLLKEYKFIDAKRYQLTDFTVYTGSDNVDYVAGTGIYYPTGAANAGYPFIAVYERGNLNLLYFGYYNLKYNPESADPQSCVGLRIKYNEATTSLYVCGTMVDRLFVDLNFEDLIGKSKGFILKVRPGNWNSPSVRVFTPDNIPGFPDAPLFAAITDMEFYPNGSKFAFTGINTKQNFEGYYGPIIGEMASDLSLQWCKTYNVRGTHVSGVDVEYNTTSNRLLVMMNKQDNHFAIMETDFTGAVTQNPVNYTFSYSNQTGNTKAHIMHYNATDGIIVTGNSYFSNVMTNGREQWLYRYIITNPSNLMTGSANFNSYSEELLPTLGLQEEVTGYWTPENSVYQSGNLSLVGCYNDNNSTYGFTFINVIGMSFEQGCIETGNAVVSAGVYLQNLNLTPSTISTTVTSISVPTKEESPITPAQDCPPMHGKSFQVLGENPLPDNTEVFTYLSSNEGGIYANFYVTEAKTIAVSVFDMSGKRVYTGKLSLEEGNSSQYLRFNTHTGVYMIMVNDGSGEKSYKILVSQK
jgi:hypothetical protein